MSMCANALSTKVGFHRNVSYVTEFNVFEKYVNKNRENSKLIEISSLWQGFDQFKKLDFHVFID